LNCTALVEEDYSSSNCKYADKTSYSESDKLVLLKYISNTGRGTLKSFEYDKDTPLTFELNNFEIDQGLNDEDKGFLKDLSALSIFGYVVFAFLKRYYIVLGLL